MPRLLRIYLLGCIAIAFTYLVLHAREPLRLNVGDPWSDAASAASVEYLDQSAGPAVLLTDVYRPPYDGPTGIVHGAMAKLGISDVGTLRLVALGFSVLWVWLVFAYVRRLWDDTVALLAAALLATSMLWMMYADSIARPPIVHTSCFLALWGVASGIEAGQRRHYAAALVGSFGCLFGGIADWGLLMAGLLFTISAKRGRSFGLGNLGLIAVCGVGALAAIQTKSLFIIGPTTWHPGEIEWQAAIDRRLVTSLAAFLRRYVLLFTPMFWITLGYATWRALRAPSLRAVIEDGTTWLLAVAALTLGLSEAGAASPMLRTQPILPLYAIGTAVLIARLLEGRRVSRALAVAWTAVAPAWGLGLMLSHPRSTLDPEEVAKTRSYLATSDRNDFVMSNLLSDGPIQTAFTRHQWPALTLDDQAYAQFARVEMLNVLDATGADYLHAVIFTTPESRFVDRSLGQLVPRGRLASVTGWPDLARARTNEVIRDYDQRVRNHLEAVGAHQVLHLSNFDVFRVDRSTVLELAGRALPVTRVIDFSSPTSDQYKLLGWSSPGLAADDPVGATRMVRRLVCWNPVLHSSAELSGNACETLATTLGLSSIGNRDVARAQLMIRVERACDLQLTLALAPSKLLVQLEDELASSTIELSPATMAFASSTRLDLAVNDFAVSQCFPARQVSVVVPQRAVRAGVNVITLDKQQFGLTDPWTDITSLTIEPRCESAP